MMTVSAVARLIPNPPALVERRNANAGDEVAEVEVRKLKRRHFLREDF